MKFGKLLLRRVELLGLPADHYISYKDLCRLVKETESASGDIKTELIETFKGYILEEIAKVDRFYNSEISELEKEFRCLANALAARNTKPVESGAFPTMDIGKEIAVWQGAREVREAQQSQPTGGGLDASTSACLERVCHAVDTMRTFKTLNHLGFRKILKKMDRRGGTNLEHEWMRTHVRTQAFYASTRFARLVMRIDCIKAVLEHRCSTDCIKALHTQQDSASPSRLSTTGACHLNEEDFSCAICMSTLNRPVLLSCAHRFCEDCAFRSYEVSPNCPICRLPDAIDPTLPVDAILSAFLELERHAVVSPARTAPTKPAPFVGDLLTIAEGDDESEDSAIVSTIDLCKRLYPKHHKKLASMLKLLDHCQAGSFLVLDIDETILVNGYYPCMLLTNHGMGLLNKDLNSLDNSVAQDVARTFQQGMHLRRCVEQATPAVIRTLQDRGVKVFALTARMSTTWTRTNAELEQVGIDFTRTAPFPNHNLLTDPVTLAECRDGVIYTNAKHKGTVLNRFLEGFCFRSIYEEACKSGGKVKGLSQRVPKEIVFVDDRQANLTSVVNQLRVASHFHIQVTTYHYTRATYRSSDGEAAHRYHGPGHAVAAFYEEFSGDNTSPVFRADVLQFQLEHLLTHNQILSDAQVLAIQERAKRQGTAHQHEVEEGAAKAASADNVGMTERSVPLPL